MNIPGSRQKRFKVLQRHNSKTPSVKLRAVTRLLLSSTKPCLAASLVRRTGGMPLVVFESSLSIFPLGRSLLRSVDAEAHLDAVGSECACARPVAT